MRLEKGIRLGTMSLPDMRKTGRLEPALRDYRWFHVGPEFCENLLSVSVCEDAAFLQSRGRKVCLLTPMLSDKGVDGLDAVFRGLLALKRRGRIDPDGLEITVNDYGAAELAAKRRLPFALNAGRLLYGNFFAGKDTSVGLNLQDTLLTEFFTGLGIGRVEFSAAGPRSAAELRAAAPRGGAARLTATLYYPYMNLTSSRTCLTGMPPVQPEDSVRGISCRRECRVCSFEMAHPCIKEKLVIRGNTVFLDFPEKFYGSEAQLTSRGIDRLVYCPFP